MPLEETACRTMLQMLSAMAGQSCSSSCCGASPLPACLTSASGRSTHTCWTPRCAATLIIIQVVMSAIDHSMKTSVLFRSCRHAALSGRSCCIFLDAAVTGCVRRALPCLQGLKLWRHHTSSPPAIHIPLVLAAGSIRLCLPAPVQQGGAQGTGTAGAG